MRTIQAGGEETRHTGTETGTEATCETLYENCSDADLDLLNSLADCIAADCEDLTCYDGLGDLSGECLGLTDTTPVTTTP